MGIKEAVEHGPDKDLNFQAYKKAFENGQLNHLEEDTWLMYRDGELVDTDIDREKLFEREKKGGFVARFGPTLTEGEDIPTFSFENEGQAQ